MSSKEAEKASRYIAQLYDARCLGQWGEVPELARKVEKHAPSRKCLIVAARASALMNSGTGLAGFEQAESKLGPQLSEAIQHDGSLPEDIIDAAACRAACLYATGKIDEALQRVPDPVHKVPSPTVGAGPEGWKAVSVIVTTLVRGLSLEAKGLHEEASHTYRPIIAYLSRIIVISPLSPELRRWTEELLTHICLYYAQATLDKPAQLGEAMAAFHQFSRLLDTQSGQLSTKVGTLTKQSPRTIWKAYYSAMTLVISEGLVYHPSPVHRDHESLEHRGLLEDADYLTARRLQRSDLRRVENNYEALLMRETKFPKAGESNKEIQDFVEQVMRNWRAFCGASWLESELGEGGKTAIGRRTADILYRAATKTFHSTQILRSLFTVHAYLADFDLAFKALTSYLEILTKGKARFEKSGDAGVDLDDDDVAIKFLAETIRVGCRYGAATAAEDALHHATILADWIASGSLSSLAEAGEEKRLIKTHSPVVTDKFSAEAKHVALRAIGIALATWSRHAFEPSVRSDCQQAAAAHLETALAQGLSDSQSTETFFALSLLYAEMRSITAALALVKRALRAPDEAVALANPEGVQSTAQAPQNTETAKGDILRTQRMLPMWHLLAQLFSACGEFAGATAACENGLDKFGEHSGLTEQHRVAPSPAESFLDSFERQILLEIKMTHISLLEINESPELAINACDDLLALYARIYGPVQLHEGGAAENKVALKNSGGAVRGIFHRRHPRHSVAANGPVSRPQTAAAKSATPSIHVTSAAGDSTPASPETHRSPLKKKALSIRSKKSRDVVAKDAEKKDESGRVPMPDVPHNIDPSKEPAPVGHREQPPQQDTRLPVPPPSQDRSILGTRFPVVQERRQRLTALVNVWLFVARLYRTAGQVTDAADALGEAEHVVEQLELDIASTDPSVRKLQEKSWGSSLGVDDLWAAAYAERGELYEASDSRDAAASAYETALAHNPNNPAAITALAGILLDSCEQADGETRPGPPTQAATSVVKSDGLGWPAEYERRRAQVPEADELYRLAARDRAYGLLAAVTKLGCGWDNSESWLAYARALEESGQLDKAKEALWWTVDLEDTRPVRHWRTVSPGGYVL